MVSGLHRPLILIAKNDESGPSGTKKFGHVRFLDLRACWKAAPVYWPPRLGARTEEVRGIANPSWMVAKAHDDDHDDDDDDDDGGDDDDDAGGGGYGGRHGGGSDGDDKNEDRRRPNPIQTF